VRDGTNGLEAAVEALSHRFPELHFGWAEADFRPLAYVGEEEIARWIDATERLAPELDTKTAAAYFLSIMTWQLGQVLATLYLSRLPLPRFGAEAIGIGVMLAGTEGRHSLDFDFRFHMAEEGTPLDRGAMAESIVALVTPVLKALHGHTRLAPRAMWSLLADGISAGFLSFGKQTEETAFAMAEAEAILRRPQLPLFNPRWRFATVEAHGRTEPFRLRGGCCRLYRSPVFPFCTTCVLRSEDDQIERLKALIVDSKD
jgi:Uncharacterized Fe-S protein